MSKKKKYQIKLYTSRKEKNKLDLKLAEGKK